MTSVKDEFYKNKKSWERSFIEGMSQDEYGNELPWITYQAIEFFNQNLKKNHLIFEYGCGSSTIFFAKKVKKVVSIETNEIWFEIINKKIKEQNIDNVEIFLMTDGISNEKYENFLENYQKENNLDFDFVIIDSIKRFKCAQNVLKFINNKTKIVLDDSERKHYKKIFKLFEENNMKKIDFFGIAPAQLRIKNTTIFTKKQS
jgi:tRNA A58 N-methylase Trm61